MRSDAIDECLIHYNAGTTPSRDVERAAVKEVLAALVVRAPGKSVEVRIPPFAAVQVVAGPNHRRGTPAAVVEMTATVLIQLAVGEESWAAGLANGTIRASGERSDLSALFPL